MMQLHTPKQTKVVWTNWATDIAVLWSLNIEAKTAYIKTLQTCSQHEQGNMNAGVSSVMQERH